MWNWPFSLSVLIKQFPQPLLEKFTKLNQSMLQLTSPRIATQKVLFEFTFFILLSAWTCRQHLQVRVFLYAPPISSPGPSILQHISAWPRDRYGEFLIPKFGSSCFLSRNVGSSCLRMIPVMDRKGVIDILLTVIAWLSGWFTTSTG